MLHRNSDSSKTQNCTQVGLERWDHAMLPSLNAPSPKSSRVLALPRMKKQLPSALPASSFAQALFVAVVCHVCFALSEQ